MEERKQFTMYESIYKALRRIRKKQDRADAYDLICAYALYGQVPELDSLPDAVAIAFDLIRPVLDAARKKAETGKLGGSKPKANPKHPGREKEIEKEIENEIEIETESEKEQDAAFAAPAGREEKLFSLFWEEYPNKTDRQEAWKVWQELCPDEPTVRAIREGLELWKRSGQWLDDNGRYVPTAAKWLRKGRWEAPPTARVPAVPKGASGQLGQAELEAIRQVLGEG